MSSFQADVNKDVVIVTRTDRIRGFVQDPREIAPITSDGLEGIRAKPLVSG
jgi:hypothetical protein